MPVKPRTGGAGIGRRGRLVLVLTGLLALVAALAPVAAPAQEDDPSCPAELNATQDPAVASFSVRCDDDEAIEQVRISTSEPGSIRGDAGTECEQGENRRTFFCRPTDPEGSSVSGRFTADSGDICAEPQLEADFFTRRADGSAQPQNDRAAEGCNETSEEDEGDTPEGGVDSGAGGTADAGGTGSNPGPALPLAGAGLLTGLILGTAGLRRPGQRSSD